MTQAILVWIWTVICTIWCPALWFLQEPVMVGLMLGLIYGKPTEGVIVGAAINVTFLGWISAGGANASDKQFAGLIGVLMALQTDMDTSTAVALSVPIAALGNYVHVAWMTVDSFCPTILDGLAEKGEYKKMMILQVIYGPIAIVFLRGLPMFLLALYGANLVEPILDSLPQWVLNGFQAVGGVVPALGISMILKNTAKPKFMVFFALGFAVAGYLGTTDLLFFAIVGIFFAVLYTWILDAKNNGKEAA